MNHSVIGAVIAAIIGLLIAFLNYAFSKKVLIKAAEKYSLITVVRQILQVGYLAAAYFIGSKTEGVDPVYLMVGAVVGMTLPMFFFTKKLLSVNDMSAKNKKEKEDEANG